MSVTRPEALSWIFPKTLILLDEPKVKNEKAGKNRKEKSGKRKADLFNQPDKVKFKYGSTLRISVKSLN